MAATLEIHFLTLKYTHCQFCQTYPKKVAKIKLILAKLAFATDYEVWCSLHRELQSILYGGRWWLPPSPGRGESSVSKCLWLVPTPKGVPECELTLLCLVLDADSSEIILVPLPSLISGLLARPSTPFLMLEVGSSPRVPTFRNSTYLDPQVGLTRDLGARHLWTFIVCHLTNQHPQKLLEDFLPSCRRFHNLWYLSHI
jgi:hypothetical protein